MSYLRVGLLQTSPKVNNATRMSRSDSWWLDEENELFHVLVSQSVLKLSMKEYGLSRFWPVTWNLESIVLASNLKLEIDGFGR